MSSIITPSNYKRLTNVSIVRLKKAGKRFEVACYPNKVIPWRQKIERDIDEVLQTPHIYANVSKGELAKRQDVERAFGAGIADPAVCEIILQTGELQLTEQERSLAQTQLIKELSTMIATRCLNPSTGKPYPASLVEKAMKDLPKIGLRFDRGAKQQLSEVIRKLNQAALDAADEFASAATKKSGLLLVRTQMRLCARLSLNAAETREKVISSANVVESDVEEDGRSKLTLLCDPGALRELQKICEVEVIDLRVDGDPSVAAACGGDGAEAAEAEEKEDEDDIAEVNKEMATAKISEKPKKEAVEGQEDSKAARRQKRKEKKAAAASGSIGDKEVEKPAPAAGSKEKGASAAAGKKRNKKGQRKNKGQMSDSDSN